MPNSDLNNCGIAENGRWPVESILYCFSLEMNSKNEISVNNEIKNKTEQEN